MVKAYLLYHRIIGSRSKIESRLEFLQGNWVFDAHFVHRYFVVVMECPISFIWSKK